MYNLQNHPGNAELYSIQNVRPYKHSPLRGKKAIYLGSSVTLGFGSLNESFAEYLQARDGVEILAKEAVNGTTLVSCDHQSYIPRMLRIDPNLKPDVFVCQLSTNDATHNLPLGIINQNCGLESYVIENNNAESKDAERRNLINLGIDPDCFDTKTIIGAIEFIIAYAKATWKCPVIFYTGTYYDSEKYGQMVEALLMIQRKWKITVIDQWHDEELNDIAPAWRNLYMIDGIHPTKAGYLKWWLPQFEEGMKQAAGITGKDTSGDIDITGKDTSGGIDITGKNTSGGIDITGKDTSGDIISGGEIPKGKTCEGILKFNSLIPEMTVSDIEKTKVFYLEILSFRLEYERPEDKFIFLSKEGNQIMLQEENSVWDVGKMEYPFGRGINFEMTVSDVDRLYQDILTAGITPFRKLKISRYRKDDADVVQKEFLVQDPDGYLLRFTD